MGNKTSGMARNLTGAQYAATKYNEYRVTEPMLLLDFVSKQMSGISRNKLKDILQGRGIAVDKKIVTQYNFQVEPGMIVRVSKHRRKTEMDNKWIQIVYEDKDIVIINKQAGILSMGSSAKQFCVKTILDEYFMKRRFKCHAHVVHRLDRETSGLMVYAKSIEAAQILQSDWKKYCFDRRYVSVLHGRMEQEGGTVSSWLKDNKSFVTFSSETDNGGKFAVTHYHTLQTSEHYSLVEMRLDTGRKNQIRVHMSDLGHPIVGDLKYGGEPSSARRMCLHAYRLFLYHPITGDCLEFETPFPAPFLNLLKQRSDE